jgi:hypothetical protein
MQGIICNDKIIDISLFNNFRLALQNYLKIDKFKDVKNKDDLSDVETLFIIDEHFKPNVDIWKNDDFINYLNEKNIRTIVFNFEKIYSSMFPWNVDHQNKLETIKNLYQFVSDVDDANHMGKDFVTKQLLSKDSKIKEHFKKEKKDRVLFLGQSDKIYHPNYAYSRRFQLMEEIKRMHIPIDIHITERKLTYSEFLDKLSEYKFIFNPLGTGDFLNVRFYEALEVGSIPIQQITKNMKSRYKELNFCHTFLNASDFKIPEINFKKMEYYLEDYFEEMNLCNII